MNKKDKEIAKQLIEILKEIGFDEEEIISIKKIENKEKEKENE